MDTGISFLKSKTAQRFTGLFILCAFLPTLILVVLSYNKVVNELETQSQLRLESDVRAYGTSFYDRLIRIHNELRAVGRELLPEKSEAITLPEEHRIELEALFRGVAMQINHQQMIPIYGDFDPELIKSHLTDNITNKAKPFIITTDVENSIDRIFIGINILKKSIEESYTIIAEVNPEYLWGIGPSPILPAMTELLVYNRDGKSIIASLKEFPRQYRELQMKQISKGRNTFEFELDGKIYMSSRSNLFIESRFQKTDWTILIIRARSDIMSTLDQFKSTFPFVTLLFLLLSLYLSLMFIRKGLEPLELLKEGTKRIARKDFLTLIDIKSGDEFQDLGDSFNNMASQLNKQFHILTVLNEIELAILSSFDRKKILNISLKKLTQFFQSDIAVYIEKSSSSKEHVEMHTLQDHGIDIPLIESSIISEQEKNKFMTDYNFLVIDNEQESPHFLKKFNMRGISNYLLLPLSINKQINRILILGWKDTYHFKEDELDHARQMANQLAIALGNANLQKAQKELLDSFIKLIASAIDAKSKYTGGHCARVPELSNMLANVVSESNEDVFKDFQLDTEDKKRELDIAGWLHDCGKITTPEYVVDKATKLETIYNRIHEIRTRFEVIHRDLTIEALNKKLAVENEKEVDIWLDKEHKKLLEEFEIIAKSNIGTELMKDETKDSLKNIASRTWVRNFDDTLGLAHAELERVLLECSTTPQTEKLLADKSRHIIPRENFNYEEYERMGFKTEVPEHLYNLGELYNIRVSKGTLSHEERFKIQEHVHMTLVMLEKLPFPEHLKNVPLFAGAHHETLIGTGYPRQLTIDDMPIPSRVMAIADVFEALTASDRPYKEAKTLSASIEILSYMVKDQYLDADIFKLFLSSGLYKEYAHKFLKPEQIDEVDIAGYLS